MWDNHFWPSAFLPVVAGPYRPASAGECPTLIDISCHSQLPHFGTGTALNHPPLVPTYRIDRRDPGSSRRRAINTNPIPPTISAIPAIPGYGLRLYSGAACLLAGCSLTCPETNHVICSANRAIPRVIKHAPKSLVKCMRLSPSATKRLPLRYFFGPSA